ncbi:hypothetical protein [Microvirga alba]|uniref:Uncharacterized protein n=1 Tax=Microvirga alba TaxID=2791025 RepID=A0A931BJN6_9HYPH|nr:hypothetical protein [Microvirga alba]MBF9232456.1 hypothetical protein [Microvirga alba]
MTALIIPATVLMIVAAIFVGEQGAMDTLGQRSASLQADLTKPLSYGDLDAVQILVLILLASVAALVPAARFCRFLTDTFGNSTGGR